jgi:membrane protease YdiL (CAAX protease family)
MDEKGVEEPAAGGAWPQPVTWTAFEIVVVLWLWIMFWPAVVRTALSATGFFGRFYGHPAATLLQADTDEQLRQQLALGLFTGPTEAGVFLSHARQHLVYHSDLWVRALAFPFQLASVPLVLYLVSRTRPWQIGLTTRRLGRNLVAGLVVASLLTPSVLGINFLVEWLYKVGFPGRTQEHPLTLVAQEPLWPTEVGLLVFTAIVAAPVMEEVVFRGLLQPWCATRPWGPTTTSAAALALAAVSCAGAAWTAAPEGLRAMLAAAQPVLFIAALAPVYLAVRRQSRTAVGPAIFSTAVVFAALHSTVWPSPVALLVLAVGLGTLAYRTQSLVGPIVLHGLFNGISCLMLLVSPG